MCTVGVLCFILFHSSVVRDLRGTSLRRANLFLIMIPRTSIEEANRHLNLLHSRVHELEQTVTSQHDALQAKDEHFQSTIAEISSAKDTEIESIRRKLRESEQTVVILQHQIQQKDQMIANLQHNFGVMETLLNHKASVQHLLHAMKEAEKNLQDVNGGEVESSGSHPRHKDPVVNGYGGASSSSEPFTEKKGDVPGKPGDKRSQGKSKRAGGKEFYL